MVDSENFTQIIQFLACPNDKNDLEIHPSFLSCPKCKQKFNIISENVIDFVTKNKFNIETSVTSNHYSSYYEDLKTLGHSSEDTKRLWGLKKHKLFQGYVKKRSRQFQHVIKNSIVCDVGASIGDYSFEFAKQSEIVFHCDLDLESILYASKIAKDKKLKNMFFIRCDYFFLPFKNNSLPTITCIDILMRGPEHDNKLLDNLTNCLSLNGLLLMDFHTLERTKVFKKSQRPELFYSKSKLEEIFKKFNLNIEKIYGDGYFPFIKKLTLNIYSIGDAFCKFIFPPSRWIAICTKN